MFWDPYDRQRRRLLEAQRRAALEAERRRRLEEMQRRAEEEMQRRAAEQAARAPGPPPNVQARFEQELAEARRERDEWADRYHGAMQLLEEQRQQLADERAALEAEAAAQRERLREEADAQRERLQRNAEQRAYEDYRRMVARMLEVVDDLERALAQEGGEGEGLASGVRLTHRNFLRALEQAGIERLESVGQPFDPALHEAVATLADEEAAPETVLREIAPGYRFRGTLLRPAKVVVAG